jgi:hypothetical protein
MLNHDPAIDLVEKISADLDRLKALLRPEVDGLLSNPRDPRNKTSDGKLTDRGVAVCYGLFDAGKTRYAVSQALDISFQAATHRWHAWKKLRAQ